MSAYQLPEGKCSLCGDTEEVCTPDGMSCDGTHDYCTGYPCPSCRPITEAHVPLLAQFVQAAAGVYLGDMDEAESVVSEFLHILSHRWDDVLREVLKADAYRRGDGAQNVMVSALAEDWLSPGDDHWDEA